MHGRYVQRRLLVTLPNGTAAVARIDVRTGAPVAKIDVTTAAVPLGRVTSSLRCT